MITLATLQQWLTAPAETEHLEFKEAKQQYDTNKLMRYCVALANERGGYLVLGVSDKLPRQVVGSQAFSATTELNDIKARIVEKLHIRVDVVELMHPLGRVLVFDIPSRPVGHPMDFDGAYLMRAGEDLVAMTPDQLRRIFAEGEQEWCLKPAMIDCDGDKVVQLLDTQSYFDLLNLPYPATREAVLERFSGERLIERTGEGWNITNLGALLFAKKLDQFDKLARKAPRVIVFEGTNKLKTKTDKPGNKGYAVGFQGLVEYINGLVPSNEIIEQALRREVKMFPEIAVRELVANALIHQDLSESGASVMVELYDDRMEISNPGKPFIPPDRFIDEYRSRNERLADLMRRLGVCEEKGSGVDKVIQAAEVYQLPAPDFRVGEVRTSAVLFAHKDFELMDKADRTRASYQHCCLRYVMNEKMTNQSLRERFKLSEKKSESVSRAIRDSIEAGKIKVSDPDATSLRYRSYIPFWA
ncbi:MAG: ATP-binding protein [Desulfuromonadaceae bacterium]|nr:ATP-binding protein [Desulfuromonadaceae bacterium]MDD2856349.1 ATP-binding protein [Desulfuromonadaceae bacterium]